MPKAMVLEQFNQPLRLREFPLPELPPGAALVKIMAAGICGSDVHMWEGKDPRTPLPLILGHEGVGKVVEIKGEKMDVTGEPLRPGDIILWNRGVSCRNCYFCSVLKEPSLCPNRWVYGIHKSCLEYPHLNGCYAEYIVLVGETEIIKIRESVDPAILVSASCSGATMAHAFDLACPRVGDTVLIQGVGPLGIFGVALAKDCGASKIIVIGGTPKRLSLCQKFGATAIINRTETLPKERAELVMQLTDKRGVDLAIEAVGNPEAVSEGIKLVRPGGAYLSVGFGAPAGTMEIDCFYDLVRKNLRLQGVWVSDTGHLYRAIQLILKNQNKFGELVSHRFKLEEATEALKAAKTKEAIKAVLVPGQ